MHFFNYVESNRYNLHCHLLSLTFFYKYTLQYFKFVKAFHLYFSIISLKTTKKQQAWITFVNDWNKKYKSTFWVNKNVLKVLELFSNSLQNWKPMQTSLWNIFCFTNEMWKNNMLMDFYKNVTWSIAIMWQFEFSTFEKC